MATDSFAIRPYEPGDLGAVYAVCLQTGDSGEDATGLYQDGDLLGHLYVGPYVSLEPALAFVLEDERGVCGYALGALDTAGFFRRVHEEWLPPLQARYSRPSGQRDARSRDEQLISELYDYDMALPADLESYPSHQHIDLLQHAQGRGQGTRMMESALAALAEEGSPGVHLGVGVRNVRAQGFYRKLGFSELTPASDAWPGTIVMGKRLP